MVYPRTHGETTAPGLFPIPGKGLSPYTRGNRYCPHPFWKLPGSIPVHTGKPRWEKEGVPKKTVYPRTHGETFSRKYLLPFLEGLSPYTRGNRAGTAVGNAGKGSIPVHTGKPACMASISVSSWVYPRTHGETHQTTPTTEKEPGLSPYTRGNLYKRILLLTP